MRRPVVKTMHPFHRVPSKRQWLRWPQPRSCPVWVLGSVLLMQGCGAEGQRRPIRGTVSVDQTALSRGSISFFPDRGHAGPAAGTAIINGSYQFTETNGPTAGLHRVV